MALSKKAAKKNFLAAVRKEIMAGEMTPNRAASETRAHIKQMINRLARSKNPALKREFVNENGEVLVYINPVRLKANIDMMAENANAKPGGLGKR